MLVSDKEVNVPASIAPFLAGLLDGPQPYQGRLLFGPVPLSGAGPGGFCVRASRRDGGGTKTTKLPRP